MLCRFLEYFYFLCRENKVEYNCLQSDLDYFLRVVIGRPPSWIIFAWLSVIIVDDHRDHRSLSSTVIIISCRHLGIISLRCYLIVLHHRLTSSSPIIDTSCHRRWPSSSSTIIAILDYRCETTCADRDRSRHVGTTYCHRPPATSTAMFHRARSVPVFY